jgi:DNA repair protein RecO (recombination protein O)
MSASARHGAAAPLAAFVLHQHDWSESSLIVELFTRESGRIVVAAKGAKRPTSNLRAVLMPFQRIHVSLGRAGNDVAASEVRNLRGAEWGGLPPMAGGEALLSGFYLNELLLKLLARDDPHPALWDAYAATLPLLGHAAGEAPALRAFELVLLAETGHLPDLTRETATQAPVQAERRYALHPETGVAAARAADDAALTGADLLALQPALQARDIERLGAACAPNAAALRQGLRRCLAYHLGHSPLRTRELVRELQSLQPHRR